MMKNCCCNTTPCTCTGTTETTIKPETSYTSLFLNEEYSDVVSKSCSCVESVDYIPAGISISQPIEGIKYRCEFKDNKLLRNIISTDAYVTFDDPFKVVPPFEPTKGPKEPSVSLDRFKSSDFCYFDRKEIETKFDKNWSIETKQICSGLLKDVMNFSRQQNFTIFKGLTTMEMFYTTFSFFVNDLFRGVNDTIDFFNKLILIHSVQHPPKSLEIFTPANAVVIHSFFCDTFLQNLILLKAVTCSSYIIKMRILGNFCDDIDASK